MEEKVLNTMLTNTYTRAGLIRRLSLLRTFFEHVFFTLGKEYATRDQLSAWGEMQHEDRALLDAMRAWDRELFAAFSPSNVYDLFDQLEEAVNKIPMVPLTVAVPFKEQQLVRIGTWLRSALKKRILLDVKVDDTLKGGCGIVLGGVYHDVSLIARMREHEEELLGLLNSSLTHSSQQSVA